MTIEGGNQQLANQKQARALGRTIEAAVFAAHTCARAHRIAYVYKLLHVDLGLYAYFNFYFMDNENRPTLKSIGKIGNVEIRDKKLSRTGHENRGQNTGRPG